MESDVALLVLRATIGAIFAAHGLQKLLGWWGGPGWRGWKGAIGHLGFRPILFWASISMVAELAGASGHGIPPNRPWVRGWGAGAVAQNTDGSLPTRRAGRGGGPYGGVIPEATAAKLGRAAATLAT